MPTTTDRPDLEEDAIQTEEEERLDAIEERADRVATHETLLIGLVILVMGALISVAVLLVGFGGASGESDSAQQAAVPAQDAAPATHDDPAVDGTGTPAHLEVEPYKRPDPTLPAVPPGAVKKFRVDVFEHVTKVSKDLPATRVWSFGVNGELHRGTGVSTPMVVEQGDKVAITLVNGGSKEMDVLMPHSIDTHSAEVAPNRAFKTIKPGETHRYAFVAKHPGVFMYHCATDPVLTHTGAGMVGMMVVKPKNLAPVDRELWMTQQEFYVAKKPGAELDPDRLAKKDPNVIAFNGFAAQYKDRPVKVERGERIRMYVLNAGPSIWSAFHVIGTVFDRTVVEGTVGHDAQTINLAPSQGGWVEFTLDQEGNYPFVTHAFGDMVKGAVGVLSTKNGPKAAMKH